MSRQRTTARAFLAPYQDVFTQHSVGGSWPLWRHTWKATNAYMDGLITPGKRKNMENIATRVNVGADRVERFIRESPWEYEAVQDYLVRRVPAALATPEAVWVLDDFGIAKQGKESVGVGRQYSGTLGKTGNCQVCVDLVHVLPGSERNKDQATWPLGARLYLPQAWVEEEAYADRRSKVGLPEGVVFQTKPEIAMALVDRARAAGVTNPAIVGDAGYGESGDFSCKCESSRRDSSSSTPAGT